MIEKQPIHRGRCLGASRASANRMHKRFLTCVVARLDSKIWKEGWVRNAVAYYVLQGYLSAKWCRPAGRGNDELHSANLLVVLLMKF